MVWRWMRCGIVKKPSTVDSIKICQEGVKSRIKTVKRSSHRMWGTEQNGEKRTNMKDREW